MNTPAKLLRAGRYLILLILILFSLVSTSAAIRAAPAGALVISEIYAHGGDVYQCDYVELYNGTDTAVDLSGYSIQRASASGNFSQKINLSGSVGAGAYYLIQGSCGAGGAALPGPDVAGTLAIAANNKIALVNGTALLPCTVNCGDPTTRDTAIVDFVGMGAANSFEGTAAVNPTSATAIHRAYDPYTALASNGDVDSDNNQDDFYRKAPEPRSGSYTPLTPPVNGVNGIYISHELSEDVAGDGVEREEAVDRTDDAWRLAAQTALGGADGVTSFMQFSAGSGSLPRVNPNVSAGTDAALANAPTWTYTNPDASTFGFTAVLMNMDPATTGAEHPTCTAAKVGGRVNPSQNSGDDALQGSAPEPNVNVAGSDADEITSGDGVFDAYNDGNKGLDGSPNGVLFAFSEPVQAFGAFFADLESRDPETLTQAMIDAHPAGTFAGMAPGDPIGGALATVQLFDANCDPLTTAVGVPAFLDDNEDGVNESPAVTNPATDFRTATCGGPSNTGFGCGNDTTRWIGFVRSTADVAFMLVSVGDDDVQGADGDGAVATAGTGVVTSCTDATAASFAEDCGAGTESISWGRATIMVHGASPTALGLDGLTAGGTAVALPALGGLVLLGVVTAVVMGRRGRRAR